jgi:hypothetical protein
MTARSIRTATDDVTSLHTCYKHRLLLPPKHKHCAIILVFKHEPFLLYDSTVRTADFTSDTSGRMLTALPWVLCNRLRPRGTIMNGSVTARSAAVQYGPGVDNGRTGQH